ncbi:MAG: hypothetical protein IJX81_02285 [Clostridia bacterium]|nr:hypothetical protein [Clostridia bacterium]
MEKFLLKRADCFFEAVLKLKTKEDCEKFFEDVCTMKELQDLTQRLEVAAMLQKGLNYREISEKTGASTATICRVNKCLQYGRGGYASVLAKE